MIDQRKADIYGLSAVLCWSTVAAAFKLSLVYLSPAQLVMVASIVSWVFLGGVLLYTNKLGLLLSSGRSDFVRSFLLGALNPFIYYLVLFKAYDLLPAQEAQSLNFTWALTMALLAAPILRHRLQLVEILAALVSYSGVLVIATRGQVFSMEFASPLGVGLALLSTVIWSVYWLLNTRETGDPVVSLFRNFSIALPMLLVYCLWTDELAGMHWRGLAGAAYVGLFEMGLSFILWQYAMNLTASTIRISSMIFLAPPLSLVIIYLILGEQILPSTIGGLALILAGLVLQHLRRAR